MNENFSEYKLIVETSVSDFETALNNAVKDGWVRAEPVNMAMNPYYFIHSQLMGMPRDYQPKADEPSDTKKEFINHDHN